jgi:Fic family protein
MDSTAFEAQAPGRLVSTIQGATAFVPDPLPPKIDLAALFSGYGNAMSGIGTLNAKIAQLPNPHLIIRPLQRREALLSSAMEGTYTTSDELALLEAGAAHMTRTDTIEVHNYTSALTHAVELMKSLPICHRLIKETHAELLSGLPQGRGGNKLPGQYKKDQNWIGGSTASAARFVPPPPTEALVAMDQLEAFINRPDTSDIPPLLEAGLVHYQFETIHPFADGNGRVGRILIPLILLSRNLIQSPVFYPSASMEYRKDEYIDLMFSVSSKGNWTGWLSFFLEICNDTCIKSIYVIDRLLELQQTYRDRVVRQFRSSNNLIVIDQLFSSPIVTTTIVMKLLDVTRRAARLTIANLEQVGILEKLQLPGNVEYFAAREILRVTS